MWWWLIFTVAWVTGWAATAQKLLELDSRARTKSKPEELLGGIIAAFVLWPLIAWDMRKEKDD
jgi:hypothetical protein